MKNITWWLVVVVLHFPTAVLAQTGLKVMSFNMRYDNPRDSPNHWLNRKDLIASQILFHEADLVGTQEMLDHQVKDLEKLMPAYRYAGAGRDDGKQKGEYSGILYQHETIELMNHNHFWLSLTPAIPGSKSWDAAFTRMVTWALFKHRSSGKTFYHFNTHFDHMGKEARKQSAMLLLQKINEIAGNTAVVVTGDFNAHPDDEPIQIIFDKANPLSLTDTKELSASLHYGPRGTFNAFGPKETDNTPIDYIMVKGKWLVQKHATISQTWEGRFASDHFAVFALLQFP